MPSVRCPHCGQSYSLTPEHAARIAGRAMACRKCRKMFMVSADVAKHATAPTSAAVDDVPPIVDEQLPQPARPAAPATQYVGFNKKRTVVEQQRNGLAIAALVSGIIGLIVPVVPAILAIALGIAGIRKTQDGRFGGQGLATTGIGLGVLSFALHGCIYTIVWPRYERAAEIANRVQCAANLREIGQALLMYSKSHGGEFPDRLELALQTSPNVKPQHFICPSRYETPAAGATTTQQAQPLTSGGHLSYTYVARGRSKSSHGTTVLLYEPLTHHRGDGINLLMETGEVWWVRTRTAELMIAQLSRGNNPPHAPAGVWPDQ